MRYLRRLVRRPLMDTVYQGVKLTSLGCGSFGIIRKVKRKQDGFVRTPNRLS